MIGYVWDVDEYPWLNIWRQMQNGKSVSLGLEFGTTSIGLTFKDLLKMPELFGTPQYEYIDAGQTIVKTYAMFLSEIPDNYSGVGTIEYTSKSVTITERNNNPRTTNYNLK